MATDYQNITLKPNTGTLHIFKTINRVGQRFLESKLKCVHCSFYELNSALATYGTAPDKVAKAAAYSVYPSISL